ncbi:MAG: hypothetical protein AAGU11_07520, partial [Syntrophobacteraceae bacterium]
MFLYRCIIEVKPAAVEAGADSDAARRQALLRVAESAAQLPGAAAGPAVVLSLVVLRPTEHPSCSAGRELRPAVAGLFLPAPCFAPDPPSVREMFAPE